MAQKGGFPARKSPFGSFLLISDVQAEIFFTVVGKGGR